MRGCFFLKHSVVTDILSRTVSELSKLVHISDTLHFRATLWGLRDNVRSVVKVRVNAGSLHSPTSYF